MTPIAEKYESLSCIAELIWSVQNRFRGEAVAAVMKEKKKRNFRPERRTDILSVTEL
jgi:hypothetical protein